jgi:NADPH2:quinone reductase
MSMQIRAAMFGGPEVLKAVDVDVPAPRRGEVTISVRAAGVNPSDYRAISGARSHDPSMLPVPVGYEVAGILSAIGDDTEIASGGGAVGDAVLAFRVEGGYSEAVTVAARDVFAKPAVLTFPEAANLLLVGTTAAQMLHAARVSAADTIVVHGASGATGVSVLQQAALIGAKVIGTCSESSFSLVRRFGAEPVRYGRGLDQRICDLAPGGVGAALDCVGTDEALDVSFALVADRRRIVTIAAFPRAFNEDCIAISGTQAGEFRDAARGRVIALAAAGELVVPVARTFPLTEAAAALRLLRQGHPGGKFALIP